VGTESVAGYCRDIETYLCRKNDGHLIRVVGPSFDLVSGWAARGVPLKVAFAGIDRYFERYYRNGPRRRPVRVDFCEADVLDVFDEWRRATGVVEQSSVASRQTPVESHRSAVESHQSLPKHLERVVTRLTAARAAGAVGADFDALIDAVAQELDRARASTGGVRGDARQALLARLMALDIELVDRARATLDEGTLEALARGADAEIAPFRAGMTPEAFAQARNAALSALVRERLSLPTVAFS
jgi:hypothetical protein